MFKDRAGQQCVLEHAATALIQTAVRVAGKFWVNAHASPFAIILTWALGQPLTDCCNLDGRETEKSANGDTSMKVGTKIHYTTVIYNQLPATWNFAIFQDGGQFFKMAATGPVLDYVTLLWLQIFDFIFILI